MNDLELVLVILLGVVSLLLACTCWCCHSPTDKKDAHLRTGMQRRQVWADFLRRNPNHNRLPDGVRRTTEFITNSRGMLLFTQLFEPTARPAKAVVCICHGFGDNSCWFMRYTARKMCLQGYIVAIVDHEGHGRSDGLSVFVNDFDALVGDAIDYFDNVRARFPNLKAFLYGESMGGAIALRIHQRQPQVYAGAVFCAPMAKIADEMKPPQVVINTMMALSHHFPTAAITPVPDVLEKAFQDPEKLAYCLKSPLTFRAKPRLATGRECLNVSLRLEQELHTITLPFLCLHGSADEVTSPEVSRALYEQAASTDKTLKIYEGYWHALNAGETDDRCAIVFRDIFEWLDARARPQATSGTGTGAGAGAGGGAGAGATAGAAAGTAATAEAEAKPSEAPTVSVGVSMSSSPSPSPKTPLVAAESTI